jgi:hypothetical protein
MATMLHCHNAIARLGLRTICLSGCYLPSSSQLQQVFVASFSCRLRFYSVYAESASASAWKSNWVLSPMQGCQTAGRQEIHKREGIKVRFNVEQKAKQNIYERKKPIYLPCWNRARGFCRFVRLQTLHIRYDNFILIILSTFNIFVQATLIYGSLKRHHRNTDPQES